MTNQLESHVRAAFDEIVRRTPPVGDTPSVGDTPLGVVVHSATAARRRTVQVLVPVAASLVVIGVLVAVTTRAPGPSTVSVASPVDAPPSESPVHVGDTVSSLDTRLASLLVPVGFTPDVVTVAYSDVSWVSEANTFVTPEGKVVSLMLLSKRDDTYPGEQRVIGNSTFTFLNEDGRHVYLTTGACQAVTVIPSNENGGAPWSPEALALMSQVDVDSGRYWQTPDGWTEIGGGFSESLYDTAFTIDGIASTGPVVARLRQSDAPLGQLLAVSQETFVSASRMEIAGLPGGLEGDRAWLLSSSPGVWHLGWNTATGSVLLTIETDTMPAWGEIIDRTLETGRPEFWTAEVERSTSPAITIPAAAAEEEGRTTLDTAVDLRVVPPTAPGTPGADNCGPVAGG